MNPYFLDPDADVLAPYDYPARRPGRVLVVDDDEVVRVTIRRQLESGGFGVVTASGGDEGLRLLRADPTICLVLLDLMMPHMDGWRFRRAQQREARLASIPTVIVTGTALPNVVDAELKAAAYLLKPIGREHLISVVMNFCRPNDA